MESPTRFARFTPAQARAVLTAILLLLGFVALTWQPSPPETLTVEGQRPAAEVASSAQASERDTDLALYDAVTARVAAGENYYRVAVEEQRARGFPVRPGVAVRLPTLATVSAALGPAGINIAALLLGALTLAAWWRRLGPILDRNTHRVIALGLLVIGFAPGFKPTYFVLHEVWAGMLLALALALHAPGKWRGAWVAAALALAIREHALPFVLLMGALAGWRRDWREAAMWGLLVLAFLVLLGLHLQAVMHVTGPQDALSPSWLALRGIDGWIENVVLCSGLFMLPPWVAAPLVLVPLIGWAALDDRLGLEALLLFVGYGLMFMLAGRENNFYWALVITPAWFVGLFWVPTGLRDLVYAARGNAQAG